MKFIERKGLPHDVPAGIDPTQEAFFVTICCEPRGRNQLARQVVWLELLQSIRFREQRGDWRVPLFLAMPDHVHGIIQFPERFYLRGMIQNWKRWTATKLGIRWQRDFFDHRLRSWESGEQKRRYILENPVRAGLVETPDRWPFVKGLVAPGR